MSARRDVNRNDAIKRLRRQNAALRQRIKTALSKIPPKDVKAPFFSSEEDDTHWYSRVSERTVSEVEAALRTKVRRSRHSR